MRLIDISGQTFGRLTVIRLVPTSERSRPEMPWECRCSCGSIITASGTNLRGGNTRSCGCLFAEQLAERNRLRLTNPEPWLADMILYIRKLGYRQKRNGKGSNQFHIIESQTPPHPADALSWALDLEAYKKLVTASCFYCGRPPHQEPQGAHMKGLGLKRNGIDRVDNAKGYEPGNCVPCCTSCNREKRSQSQSEFIENTRRRFVHLESKGLITK
jgi:hypothetical protein